MTQYLVAIHLPDDFDASSVDKAMEHDIDVLNEEMEAKRVRLFAGGLRPAKEAKSLRAQPDGKVLMTDGPFLETKEHVGGFWILEADDMDEALAWGRKAVVACRAPVEVRALFPSDLTALLARKPLKEGMTQYLAAGHLPENFDPSSVTEAMMRDMEALNEEMEARVSRSSLAACTRRATRSRCEHSPAVRCSSPTGHIWRPRSTWAVFRYC